MNFRDKFLHIFLQAIPIVIMIRLISVIKNDYLLTGFFILIIFFAFRQEYHKKEYIFFWFGFFGMIVSEFFFLQQGVEEFLRDSLFGVMPLWLPFLWAYSFVVIKRAVIIILKK